MISSMTGYGRAVHSAGAWSCEVEIRSVNHRFLDLATTLRGMPRAYESSVHELVRRKVGRGRIEITVQATRADSTRQSHVIDQGVVRGLMSAGRELAVEHRLASEVRLGELLMVPGVVVPSEHLGDLATPPPRDLVHEAVQRALGLLLENRRHEGARLRTALLQEIAGLQQVISEIDARRLEQRALVLDRYRERLQRWIAEAQQEQDASSDSTVDDSRILEQAAMMAERADVEEEIVRLRSHLAALAGLLEEDPEDTSDGWRPTVRRTRDSGAGHGKKIAFLIQELVRELSTVSAKARDALLTQLVVDAKSSCERLREQANNVE